MRKKQIGGFLGLCSLSLFLLGGCGCQRQEAPPVEGSEGTLDSSSEWDSSPKGLPPGSEEHFVESSSGFGAESSEETLRPGETTETEGTGEDLDTGSSEELPVLFEVLDYSVTAPNLFGFRIGDPLDPLDFSGVAILPAGSPYAKDHPVFDSPDASGHLLAPVKVIRVHPSSIPAVRFQAEVTLEGINGETLTRVVNCRLYRSEETERSEETLEEPESSESSKEPEHSERTEEAGMPGKSEETETLEEPGSSEVVEESSEEPSLTAAFDVYTTSRAAFDHVNEYRKSLGLPAVRWDEGVYRLLLIRLSELETDYSHREYFADRVGSFSLEGRTYGFHTGSECIAWAKADEWSALSDWKDSNEHDEILRTDPGKEQLSGAMAVGANGKAVFTLIYDRPEYYATMEECWSVYDSGKWEEYQKQ